MLKIPVRVVPKARPRVTRTGHAYMPATYKENQELLQIWFTQQLKPFNVPVTVELVFKGRYGKSDLDNLSGAILDAMVKSGIIANDSTKYVPALKIYHVDAPAAETALFINIEKFSESTDCIFQRITIL
jgi:Holliday junction resolvase RusA-like endonuclease